MNNYTYIDTIAKPLEWAIGQLNLKNIKYVVSLTRPKRTHTDFEEKSLFVIRQLIDDNGVYNLTVAASVSTPEFFKTEVK